MSLKDPIAAVFIFVLAAVFYYLAGRHGGGPEIFPRAIAVVMMVSSVLLFLKGLRESTGIVPIPPGARLRVAGIVVLTLLYIVAVDKVGFVTSSLVFIPVTGFVLGMRHAGVVAAATLLFVGSINFLFRNVFHVPLPPERILDLF